jgi:hypothetical protein
VDATSNPGTDLVTSTLEARAWQGLAAIAVWVLVTLGLAFFTAPRWVDPLVPLPSLAIALDTLGPRPLFVRWQVKLSRRLASALAAGVLGIAVAVALLTLAAPSPTTDQPYIITCAARDLWHGVDPYTTYEPQCLARLNARFDAITPLERGPFAHLHNYPTSAQLVAASVHDQLHHSHAGFAAYGIPPEGALLILPVAFAGWSGISLWVLALTALLVAAIWIKPPAAGRAILAWQVAALAVLWASFRWNPEDIAYLLVALSFARIDRPRISSVCLAAAVCSNPLCWITVPVYLAILARDPRRRTRVAWLVGGVAVGILPWLLWDHALLAELWRFVTVPNFPLGASLSALVHLPSHLERLFTGGLVIGIAMCTYVAWRWPAWRWSMAVVVYGAFVLGWQAPLFYIMPVLWLSPAVALGACRLSRRQVLDARQKSTAGFTAVSATW